MKMTSKYVALARLALFGLLGGSCSIAGTEIPPGAVEKGATLYQQFCAGCHGPKATGGHGGEGLAKVPPSLVDDQWIYGSTDGAIFRTIKMGTPPDYAMVPWEGVISDDDIWSIVHYLKSLAADKGAH